MNEPKMTDQTMEQANDRQVGGDHYSQEFQHWDWICYTGLGYLEGCFTKYVFRWKKKDGIEGLHKAIHYVDKTIELYDTIGLRNRVYPLTYSTLEKLTDRMVRQGRCSVLESRIFNLTLMWQTPGDLKLIRAYIQDLITEAEHATR